MRLFGDNCCSFTKTGRFLALAFTISAIFFTEIANANLGFKVSLPFRRLFAAGLLVPSILLNPIIPSVSHAAQQIEVSPNDLNRLKLGLREVNYLIDNWDEKTTYCNFGEFQRELLLPENKGKLLDAAKEFSLWDYDKTKTMNVMCKRDPQVVR
jgi:hypothetical protein